LQAEWGVVGVTVVRAPAAEADLQLVDEVAPADLASWYLRHFTCDRSAVCSPEADAALAAAQAATTLAERNTALAAADRTILELTPFIAIASPLRWSLVAPQLDGFRPNPRAVHPLHHLRAPRD
jgi:oligopeptide transport system substrate-binding protein